MGLAMRWFLKFLADIQLEGRGGDIIVDLPSTNYSVTYHKPGVSPQLLVSYLPGKIFYEPN
jgi:hypothetical protein